MVSQRDVRQYGDFQTPQELADAVCRRLVRMGLEPAAVLEPTCGRGAFLVAAERAFPGARTILGVDIDARHVAEARDSVRSRRVSVTQGDYFAMDWERILARGADPWLVLGNPPWVTNSELGRLKSANLPAKSNIQGHRGLDALTGKANFDISESMLMQQIGWLEEHTGWSAMLVKTAVARKVLRGVWSRGEPVGRAALFKVDALQHFGAAVDACLFVLPVGVGPSSQECDVFDSLAAEQPSGVIGRYDGVMVSDVGAFLEHRALIGVNADYIWRSGVKHDCSRVMELITDGEGRVTNGFGERLQLEDTCLFPMLKSSDIAKGRLPAGRFMLVPQRAVGDDTSGIKRHAPRTWAYLTAHGDRLDARSSAVYRGKPRFSVFGVGSYTFAPWKVAVSGFYRDVRFVNAGSVGGKPVVVDDTVYFIPCRSEAEADFVLALVRSEPFTKLAHSMIFPDEKRPVTAELLKRISLERVAAALGMGARYRAMTTKTGAPADETTGSTV
ncbi:MAG: hypothetical protein LBR29_02625 [Methylobacteriaceae bacterium]|nr:hypothetical protein [Methylobacteriaceae bacterium]